MLFSHFELFEILKIFIFSGYYLSTLVSPSHVKSECPVACNDPLPGCNSVFNLESRVRSVVKCPERLGYRKLLKSDLAGLSRIG